MPALIQMLLIVFLLANKKNFMEEVNNHFEWSIINYSGYK